MRGSEISKIMAVAIAVVGAIAGFVAGASVDGSVSFFAALPIWLSTALITVGFLLCYCHFKNQEEMKKSLSIIANSLTGDADEEGEYEYEYLED